MVRGQRADGTTAMTRAQKVQKEKVEEVKEDKEKSGYAFQSASDILVRPVRSCIFDETQSLVEGGGGGSTKIRATKHRKDNLRITMRDANYVLESRS